MKEINFGVLGAGNFAGFAVREFNTVPGCKLTGVYDQVRQNAERLKAINRKVKIYLSEKALMDDPALDLVYIATPPYLHYPQSKMALLAGKHVICEKPASIHPDQAIELRALAREKHLLFVVNLMQRYNPLYASVTALIRQNILGGFLHGFFENYASDEFLTESHWFWKNEFSGGIFIEHGVHFFDMFSGWFGDGRVISAQKVKRSGHPQIVDKYQSIVAYGDALVNFYHGFDQPKAMDRQELRLQFERGEITLYEWVPTRLVMNALCTEQELEAIKTLFPKATTQILEHHDLPKMVTGKFKSIAYNYKLNLDTGSEMQKMSLYAYLVRTMFKDQTDWIRSSDHVRTIDEDNAVNSLLMAEASEKLATVI